MKPTYQHTEQGVVVVDTRQYTNGPIVPNYVIDLYLPIIGCRGLGVYTALVRRMGSRTQTFNLEQLATTCRLGRHALNATLALLEELKFIRCIKPTGKDKIRHFCTVIEICSPPTGPVPITTQQSLVPWLFSEGYPFKHTLPNISDQHSCNASDRNSMGCTHVYVPIHDEMPSACTQEQTKPIKEEEPSDVKGTSGIKQKQPALSTQLVNAYRETVTSLGHLTGMRNTKDILVQLNTLQATPDELRTMIIWRLEGYPMDRACHYHFAKVPDDVRTYRVRHTPQPEGGNVATPPLEPEQFSDGFMEEIFQ